MGLSKQKDSLYDPFRQCYVAATPEELVRQKLLQVMVKQLGYPKQLISVEKRLSDLPHLRGQVGLPNRRADILCFAKNIHPEFPLYPLLLIECKEGLVGREAASQALGYNHFVQSLYVGLAGEDGVSLIYPQEVSFLPSYAELLGKICR